MKLTSRQRFKRTIRFDDIDRPFRWETIAFWPTTIKKWKDQGLPKEIEKDSINEYFDMDRIEFIPIRSGWTGTPFYPFFNVKVLEEDERTLTRLEEDGIVKKQKRDEKDTSMPQFLRFPVESMKDFGDIRWRLDPGSKKRLPDNWEELINTYTSRDFPLGLWVCGSFGHPRNLMGDERLMMALYDDKGLIKAIMENWVDLYKGFIAIICKDIIPDFVLTWEDMAYKNGSLISPRQFDEFMVPYLSEIIDFIKYKGIDTVILDSDGNIKELIPLFLKAGVNAILPFEVQAGMDIVQVRKEYKDRLAIIGGIDKKLLHDGQRLKEEIGSKVPYMLDEGGYIPSLDHTVPSDITIEEFRHYLELVRRCK